MLARGAWPTPRRRRWQGTPRRHSCRPGLVPAPPAGSPRARRRPCTASTASARAWPAVAGPRAAAAARRPAAPRNLGAPEHCQLPRGLVAERLRAAAPAGGPRRGCGDREPRLAAAPESAAPGDPARPEPRRPPGRCPGRRALGASRAGGAGSRAHRQGAGRPPCGTGRRGPAAPQHQRAAGLPSAQSSEPLPASRSADLDSSLPELAASPETPARPDSPEFSSPDDPSCSNKGYTPCERRAPPWSRWGDLGAAGNPDGEAATAPESEQNPRRSARRPLRPSPPIRCRGSLQTRRNST